MKFKSKFIIAISAIILMTATIFIACQKSTSNKENVDELSTTLKEFTGSTEFNRSINLFQDLGKIDAKNSKSEIVKANGKDFLTLRIYFTKNNNVTGFVEAIKMNPKIKNIIPNDDKYLMTLVKYNNYDFESRTGNIMLYDLNYDNFNYASLSLENGNFKNKKIVTLPQDISIKYQNLKKKKDIVNNATAAREGYHLCDQNQNGNVGYFECVGCFLNSCWTSYECTGMCAVFGPYCGSSIFIACTYLSIAY